MYICTYKRAGVRVYVPDLFSIRWCFVQSLKAICTRGESRAENKTPTGCFASLFSLFFFFFFSFFSYSKERWIAGFIMYRESRGIQSIKRAYRCYVMYT